MQVSINDALAARITTKLMNHLPPVTAAATTNNPRPILTGRSMATPRPDYTPDGPGGHPRIRVGFELFTDVTAFLAMSGRLLDVGLNAEKNAEEPGRFSPLLSRRRLAHLTGMKWRIFSPRRPPRIHRTCIPTRADKPPVGPDWIHEIKHDGYRMIVRKKDGRVRLFTRRDYDWTDRFPLIREAAAALRANSLVLDGEGVTIGDTTRIRPPSLKPRTAKSASCSRPHSHTPPRLARRRGNPVDAGCVEARRERHPAIPAPQPP